MNQIQKSTEKLNSSTDKLFNTIEHQNLNIEFILKQLNFLRINL